VCEVKLCKLGLLCGQSLLGIKSWTYEQTWTDVAVFYLHSDFFPH
jgi:hypothetical protein